MQSMKKRIMAALVCGMVAVSALTLTACGEQTSGSAPESQVVSQVVSETADFNSLTGAEKVAAFAAMSGQEAYDTVKNSKDSWCVEAYDLITPDNIKSIVILTLSEDGTASFNLNWPIYGGYAPETIASIGELSGDLHLSRDGGDGGYTVCYGQNEDGTEYTDSQRSMPKSSATINTGTFHTDLYKDSVDIVTGDGTDAEKIAALVELGISEEAAPLLLSDYAAWLTRTEIAGENSIADGAASVGHTVESKYGYYGKTAPWSVTGLDMVGGSGQMNVVYSWGTLKASGLLTDLSTAEIA